MIVSSPHGALNLIRTRMEAFARGGDDDPKTVVDSVMHDIEAILGEQADGAATFLDDIAGHTRKMIADAEGQAGRGQRRILFLRSVAQLLASRCTLFA